MSERRGEREERGRSYLKGHELSDINSAVVRQAIIGEIKIDNLSAAA